MRNLLTALPRKGICTISFYRKRKKEKKHSASNEKNLPNENMKNDLLYYGLCWQECRLLKSSAGLQITVQNGFVLSAQVKFGPPGSLDAQMAYGVIRSTSLQLDCSCRTVSKQQFATCIICSNFALCI